LENLFKNMAYNFMTDLAKSIKNVNEPRQYFQVLTKITYTHKKDC